VDGRDVNQARLSLLALIDGYVRDRRGVEIHAEMCKDGELSEERWQVSRRTTREEMDIAKEVKMSEGSEHWHLWVHVWFTSSIRNLQ
jgi:hypothetical protein